MAWRSALSRALTGPLPSAVLTMRCSPTWTLTVASVVKARPPISSVITRHVHHLGDVVGDRREPFEALLGDRTHAHLQRQVRDGRGEVAVAGALAVAVDRALHVGGAAPYARERVGDAAAGVVVGVHA